MVETHRSARMGTLGVGKGGGVSAWMGGRGVVVVGRCPWERVGVLVGACGHGGHRGWLVVRCKRRRAGWEVLERICSGCMEV